MYSEHFGELLGIQIYDTSHGPQQNVERVAQTLGRLRQFLVREPKIFESPLRAQAFVKSLQRPPGTKDVQHRSGCCAYTTTESPVKHCFCTLTPQDYVRPPVPGETLEQLCIVQWQSQKERRRVEKKNRDWWDNTFITQINQALKDEKVAFVDHWTIEFERWELGHQAMETSSNLGRCLQRLARYMSFRN